MNDEIAAPTLNPHLGSIQPYPPGKPIEEVQREYGLQSVIKMASNENPLGPSPRALKAMAKAAREVNLYPDGAGFYLKAALAAKLGVAAEEIVLGNGSDEITGFLAQCYLGPGRELVTSDYAFLRYAMAAQLVDAQATLVPMRAMRHDLKAIGAAISPATTMLCLDIPCNPTGSSLGRRELATFLKKIPPAVIVVLDQAYFEYAQADPEYPDGLAMRRHHPNMVVTRTFSKAYGLAGLRIGYAVMPARMARDLDRVRPPFNTNRLAQAAALAALDDTAHLRRSIRVNAAGLTQLESGLRKLGVKTWPSRANFLLADLRCDARRAFEELLKLGVVTRPMSGYGLTSSLRISIGAAAENRRCLAALARVLGAMRPSRS